MPNALLASPTGPAPAGKARRFSPLLPLGLILGITLWRLAVAALVPVTQDEAYYFHWARALAWGYFDHPPGVALLGLGTRLEPGSAFAARLGAVLAGLLTLLILWRFYRACGLRRGDGLLLALVLAVGTLPGLIGGVITTPDTVLTLCWALALHEALAALRHDRRRWLTAGLATGLGLLGKYSMVLIGPVFLWAMLAADRRALATPWPYLGGLLALLVFSPNLIWNANNDWISLRFQFGHGFATDTGGFELPADSLPPAVGAFSYSPPDGGPDTPAERLASLAGFLGTQLAFWGLLLLPLAASLWRRGGPRRAIDTAARWFDQPARTLLVAAAVFPLALFSLLALKGDVEANWSATYLIGAVPLAAALLAPLGRRVLIAAAGNLMLVSLYALHAATASLPLPDASQRILRESYGYPALAAYATTLSAPVFADRYPFAAMLNFYAPELGVGQWPNIARPSEYSRWRLVAMPEMGALQATGFWLVAYKFAPPEIPGFRAVETRSLFQCRGQPLMVVAGGAPWEAAGCPDPIQGWRLYRYVADGVAEGGNSR
jgi:4-amino-4-deoxy-L-arabinose transferase-like glycosyltransferase